MIRVLTLVAWSVMIVILVSSPAHARRHKKKPTPTPTPSPSVRLQNPQDAPDHAQLKPEDLEWLNQ